jgi:hypothetical protein
MLSQYFNPNPINVARANWESNYGNFKIVVEMRDVNYPGSTYTLNDRQTVICLPVSITRQLRV